MNIAAFPSVLQYFPEDTNYQKEEGMTLRDYFAAKAMAVLMNQPISNHGEETIAQFAYDMADAMLEARK